MHALPILTTTALLLMSCAATPASPTPADLRQQVWDTELAFAATMADRDHSAFVTFLADDAVFVSGSTVLRGRVAVAAGWKPLFEGPDAPFSWEPDSVELLDSEDLARSTGPVTAADGSDGGRFVSIWLREANGWRIVSDRGEP
jgi:ketosteroid isomerase-like protein